MKKLSIGIFAHVDAGKTTLTESILYLTGMIKTQGRVDNGDAFLDTDEQEKKRGVTIYSKQAVIDLTASDPLNRSGDDLRVTLIDTPGHTDFVGETERALPVIDLAVLIISALDGVTDSARRLVMMLKEYHVPYVVFVNKMDMARSSGSDYVTELEKEFGTGFIPLNDYRPADDKNSSGCDLRISDNLENIASLSEKTIEKYLNNDRIENEDITDLIYSGCFHPVIFGSAINNSGTGELLGLITGFIPEMVYKHTPSAKIFKISMEEGHKLSFAKITGGQFKVRETLPDPRLGGEKITQIRRYSGGKYESIDAAEAGDVVTFIGPEQTFAGMGIGEENDDELMINRPVLRYRVILPDDEPVRVFIPKIRELASEDPLLNLDVTGDVISISVMGRFQLEILAEVIRRRFGVSASFDQGEIIYKETIAEPVMGFGHFEPLKHYSEVHLLLEPLPPGSGIEIASAVSVNDLSINWQRNIMSTLINDIPPGVLTGSGLTDMKITIAAGRSHVKHTEGGDFREATRRALRQALMKAENILLEPYYEFHITLSPEYVGRAMNDVSLMGGESRVVSQTESISYLQGFAPARELMNYQNTLTAYTSGQGRMELGFAGYRPCSDDYAISVCESTDYDPDGDLANPSGSVFCSHGAGVYVPWYEVEEHMHLPSREPELIYDISESEEDRLEHEAEMLRRAKESRERTSGPDLYSRLDAMGTEEIDEILKRTTHSNAVPRKGAAKRLYRNKRVVRADSKNTGSTAPRKKTEPKPRYLLVDGYNIIHAWDELKALLGDDPYSMDGAKYRLLDILSEYRIVRNTEVIAVFDAYKVKGHVTEKMDYMGVHVVYTKTAETADQYIARFTVLNSRDLDITVATSDGLVQLIIRGENCRAYSAADLLDDVRRAHQGQ